MSLSRVLPCGHEHPSTASFGATGAQDCLFERVELPAELGVVYSSTRTVTWWDNNLSMRDQTHLEMHEPGLHRHARTLARIHCYDNYAVSSYCAMPSHVTRSLSS